MNDVGVGVSQCKCEDRLPLLNNGVGAVSCHFVCLEVKLPLIFIPSCKLSLIPISFASEILNQGKWRILGLIGLFM